MIAHEPIVDLPRPCDVGQPGFDALRQPLLKSLGVAVRDIATASA
jgi:hypothetical protein